MDFEEAAAVSSRGFQTASGKSVSVSAAALARARGLWEEVDRAKSNFKEEDKREGVGVPEVTKFGGFATASGKNVQVSAAALKRARGLWDEIEGASDNAAEEVGPPVSKLGGFSAASGKSVQVSDAALKRARGLWDEVESVQENGTEEDQEAQSRPGKFGGFSTASGKSVQVSEAALKRARGLWDEVERVENDCTEEEQDALPVAGKFGGFSTASGKSVQVSEAALKRARGLWDDVESAHNDSFEEEKEVKSVPAKSEGFSTASGNNVSVSAEALMRAKNLWDEECSKDTNDMDWQDSALEDASSSEKEEREILRENVTGPLFASTPVAPSVHRPAPQKPRAFVTPFRKNVVASTSFQQNISPLAVPHDSSVDKTTEHGTVSTGSARRTLGARLGKVSSALGKSITSFREPQKRDRSLSEDPTLSHHKLSKTPKMSQSLPSYNVSRNYSPALTRNLDNVSNSPSTCNISITESQEILESSKALLEDENQLMVEDEKEPSTAKQLTGPLPFHMIPQDGKPIPHIKAMVTRVYPISYACKSVDKKIEFFSEASYERLRSTRDREEEREVEKLYAQVEAEMRKANAARIPRYPLSCLNKKNLESMSVEELLEIAEGGDDFSDIYVLLSPEKLQQLLEAKEKKREESSRAIKKEVENRLQSLNCGFVSITPVLKIRLMDMSTASCVSAPTALRHAVLSFWRPSEELCSNFQEGSVYDIISVTLGHTILEELRLNSMRGTQIQPLKHPLAEEMHTRVGRRSFRIADIIEEDFTPVFNEFDFVGVIVLINNDPKDAKGEVVYFADESENVVGLKLWKSIREEGVEKFLSVGNIVAVMNAQWRQSSRTHEIPWGFVQDTTMFTTRPKEAHIRAKLDDLRKQVVDVQSHVNECESRIRAILGGDSDSPKTPPLARRIQRHYSDEVG